MGDDTSNAPRKNSDMGTASGSDVNEPDTVDQTLKVKQPAQRPGHRREASVDMLGQGDAVGTNSASNSTTDETGSSNADSLNPSNTSTMTSATINSNPQNGSTSTLEEEMPSIDDQVGKVLTLTMKPLQVGQKGYAVTTSWLQSVMARSSHRDEKDTKFDKIDTDRPIGPVDNSDIVLTVDSSVANLKDENGDPYVPLRPGVVMGEDFELLPEEAWDLILKWYGLAEGSPVIARYVRNTNPSGDMENNVYELNPPILTVLKLPSPNASQLKPPNDLRPLRFLVSRQTPFNKWLKQAKEEAGIDMHIKVRVWRILSGLGGSSNSGIITPVASRSASPAPGATIVAQPGNDLVLDLDKFVSLQEGSQRELLDVKDQTSNEKYNGNSTIEMAGLGADNVVVLEEQIGGPGGGEWTTDSRSSKKNSNLSLTVTKSGGPKSKAGASGRSSPALGGVMTRGRQRRDGKPKGITGLSNLGNTCYMNSALQCVRSVEELTQYFLLDKHKPDLNPRNPLAHNGEVAKAYAGLLSTIYSDSAPASFPPRQIKATIGRYGPNFSGYGQQDSQEFLGFLLDGLQEDLNRVKDKPYIEKPDSTDEMVHDHAALKEMADKCWDIYKARSDSVVTDLFAGMYKSTLHCPVCDKVSIIFDPFNNLTLQIPVQNLWSKEIFYFPLNEKPIRVAVDIDKNSTVLDLKHYVAKRTKSDPKKLIMVEIYKHKVYKFFENVLALTESQIGPSDDIAIYEVEDIPTNYNPDKPPKPRYSLYATDDHEVLAPIDSPKCDRLLTAIYLRYSKPNNPRSRMMSGAPLFIIVTREEARDYDVILKKCLAAIATLTTRDFVREATEEMDEDELSGDPDTVVTNEEDYSSSDSKVQAASVEGDDSLVDVSMKDDADAMQPTQSANVRQPKPLPEALRPGTYIPPLLQNLFEVKVFPNSDAFVPVSWSAVDENRDFTPMLSRIPSQRDRLNKERRPFFHDDSSRSSDEDVDDPPAPVNQNIRGADYDSEYETSSQPKNGSDSSNDEELPSVQNILHPGSRANGRNSRSQVTYSKKVKKNGSKKQQDAGPYLRPGEGIILDWSSENWDAIFGAVDEREARGWATWSDIPLLPDPALEKKRQYQAMRRKKGFTLEDCLDEFGKSEILSENDAWYCPRCKEHRRASKTFELWKAPDILVVHFKRFSANRSFRDKLDVLVDFPVEGLDLRNRVAMDEGKGLVYDLIAVDNHYGGLGGGHYTAYAKNFIDGNWYEYNDSQVSKKNNPEVVVTHAAYLLFYRRRSDHPLGGKILEEIVTQAHKADSDSLPCSRAESPSGEGQRLGGSSPNGSSSAYRGVGAAHQQGDGGLGEGTLRDRPAPNGDELPDYSSHLHLGEQILETADTIEGMDVDEAIAGMNYQSGPGLGFEEPGWGFDQMQSQISHVPPGSLDNDIGAEDALFDAQSNRAASTVSGLSDPNTRLRDFGGDGDEGTLEGQGFDSTPLRNSPIIHTIPPPIAADDDDDLPVMELHHSES